MSTSWGTREVGTVDGHGGGGSGRAANGARSGTGRPGGAGRPAAAVGRTGGRSAGRANGSGRAGRVAATPRPDGAGSARTNGAGRGIGRAAGRSRTNGTGTTAGAGRAAGRPRTNGTGTDNGAGASTGNGTTAGASSANGSARSNGTGISRAGRPRTNGTGAGTGTRAGRAVGSARTNGTGNGSGTGAGRAAGGSPRTNGAGTGNGSDASTGNGTTAGGGSARSNGNGSGAGTGNGTGRASGPPRTNGHGVAPPRGRRAKAKPTGPSRQIVAGLDVGGTKTLAVAAGAAGAIIATVRRPTVSGSREKILRSTTEALVELGEAVGCGVDGFAAVGVGIPGLVDVNAGTVRHAVNLGLGSAPLMLADRLGEAAGAPVVVDNDVNVAAIGAAAALGCRDLAYLSVGTGIAAGLLLGGRLRRGARGAAGEIGHLPVDPDGPTCDCGQRGCLEAVASGPALARRWPPGDGAPSVTSALLDAAAAGDGTAIEVRDAVAGHLADAVAMLAQTVDPDLVVLGGGVAEAGDPLLDAVVRALAERAERSPVVAALDLTDRVALVPDGVPVGALGAALAARRQVMTRLDAVAGPAFEVREAM